MRSQNHLRNALEILNSLFSVVFLMFILDSTIVTTYVDNRFASSLIGRALFFFFIPLRVYLCAGFYGLLVEIASGEQRLFSWARFAANARQSWKVFLVLAAVPYLVSLFFMFSLSGVRVPLMAVAAQVNLFILFILSAEIIRVKYGPFPVLKNKQVFSCKVLVQILALYLGGLILSVVPLFVADVSGYFYRAAVFCSKYLFLLEFLFWTQLLLSSRGDVLKNFNYEKELILVNPFPAYGWTHIPMGGFGIYPPIFVVLRALTPKIYKIREYNKVFWRERYYDSHKLVAITCYTNNSPEAYKIAKEFRRRGSKVVMGGPHVSLVPEEALAFCDSVVIGEAEGVWRQVVADYEGGCLKPQYSGEGSVADYDEVHRELMASPPAVIRCFLEGIRGCKFRCHWCAIPTLNRGVLRRKPIAQIVEEIKKVRTRYNHVIFLDNNIYNDPEYARELFGALKPLKIQWTGNSSIDIARNEPMLKLAKESGCRRLLIGYEIFPGSSESEKGGKLAMVQHYFELTRRIKKYGIRIVGGFIFGFDSDSFRSLWALWKSCFQIRPTFAILNLLILFPGTMSYSDALKENRLVNLNWRRCNPNSFVFEPKKMKGRLLSRLFPLIQLVFLLTTCDIGFVLLFLGALISFLFFLH